MATPIEVSELPESETAWWKTPFTLRDYQQEALAAFEEHHRGTIVLPTGAGKTNIFIAAIADLKVPTVILVPTKVLIDQTVARLRSAGIRTGVYYGERKEIAPVLVATYQSLYEVPDLIRNYPFIVADEGDLATADQWSAMIRESQAHPYAMLLTATPPTEPDRRAVLDTFLPIIYRKRPAELIRGGHMARVEPVPYFVALPPGEMERYQAITETIRNVARKLGTHDPKEIQALTHDNDLGVRQLAYAYFAALNDRTELLASAPSKAQALLDIARLHPEERILVFATRVEIINAACNLLSNNNVPCRVITGATSTQSRRDIFDQWGKTFWVLGSVGVLVRGVDVPEVGIAVLLGGGRGERALIQKIGRIVRPSPEKEYATVYVVAATGTIEEKNYPKVQQLFEHRFAPPPEFERGYGGGKFKL